jgi:hypothetical protein
MSFSERTWNINKQCSYDIYKQNVLNILLDPQSTFDSPLYGPNDGYIVGPSEITTSTDIYRSGSNAEF